MTVGNDFVRFGVNNVILPPEGPRVMPFIFDFQVSNNYTQDLLIPIQNNIIKHIQTLYIDNSANPVALNCLIGLNGQRIICPARSQGYFSILFNDQDSVCNFTTTQAGGVVVSVFFINVPIMPSIWRTQP